MKRFHLSTLGCLFFLLAGSGQLSATQVVALNVTDLAREAVHVFEGRCLDVTLTSVKDSRGEVMLPAVRYTFEILDSLKGKQSSTFEFMQLGNAAKSGHFPIYADRLGIPTFEKGRTYLLFLAKRHENGLTAPVGLAQGMFWVHDGLAYNGISNAHIFHKMDRGMSRTTYAAMIRQAIDSQLPGRAKRGTDGVPAERFKALLRDMLTGHVVTVSKKAGDR